MKQPPSLMLSVSPNGLFRRGRFVVSLAGPANSAFTAPHP